MAPLIISDFEGLTDEDFDVYERSRWSDNRFNLARMRAKERVLALAGRMREAVDDLALESSSEIPSVWNGRSVQDQWAYLLRGAEARRTLQPVVDANIDLVTDVSDPAEHHRHAVLFLRLHHDGVDLGLRINHHAAVDLENLLGHARSRPDDLVDRLKALPSDVKLDRSDVGPTAAALLAAGRAARAGEVEWLGVTRALDRREAIALGTDLGALAAEVTGVLVPLYRFLAWSPQNDHIGVNTQLGELAEERARHEEARASAAAEVERAHAERAREAQARAEAKAADREAWQRTQQEARRRRPPREETGRSPRREPLSVPTPTASTRAPKEAPPARRPAPAKSPAKSSSKSAPVALAVGDACRLQCGLFAGKEGIVAGVDKKGYYQIKVGNLEVRVTAAELEKI